MGQLGPVQSGCRRDVARRLVDVINLARVSEKRFGVDTARQLTALAIEHLAANGTGIDRPKLLALGAGGELVMLAKLNLDQAGADGQHPDNQCERNNQRAAAGLAGFGRVVGFGATGH